MEIFNLNSQAADQLKVLILGGAPGVKNRIAEALFVLGDLKDKIGSRGNCSLKVKASLFFKSELLSGELVLAADSDLSQQVQRMAKEEGVDEKFLRAEAVHNIKEFLSRYEDRLGKSVDLFIIPFEDDSSLAEAELCLAALSSRQIVLLVGFNFRAASASLMEDIAKRSEMVLTEDSLHEGQIREKVISLLEKNSNFICSRMFTEFKKFSVERHFTKFATYAEKLMQFLTCDPSLLKEEFNAFEKFSFSSACIADEALIVLQALAARKIRVEFDVNYQKCHVCKKEIRLHYKVILSKCRHCYCKNCIEYYCSNITEKTMRLSRLIENRRILICIVGNCGQQIAIDDLLKVGIIFEDARLVNNK